MERNSARNSVDDRNVALNEIFPNGIPESKKFSLTREPRLVTAAVLKARADRLNEIFGSDTWKSASALIFGDPNSITQSMNFLNFKLSSPEWKNHSPGLVGLSVQALELRTKNLESILGNPLWQRKLRLIFYSPESIKRRAQNLDALVGSDRWKKTPELLYLRGETILNNAAGMYELFGEIWKNVPTFLLISQERVSENVPLIDKIIGGRRWIKEKRMLNVVRRNPERITTSAKKLNELFGEGKWQKDPYLLAQSQDVICERVEKLNQAFGGEGWKTYPEMLMAVKAVARNMEEIDKIFDPYNWKKHPNIAISALETIRTNAFDHTKSYGSSEWMTVPSLATVTCETFNSSLVAMKRVLGIEKVPPILLATTVKLKKEKVRYIRQILGHKYIDFTDRIFDPSTELPEFSKLNEVQKLEEEMEIGQILDILRKKIRLLAESKKAIGKYIQKTENLN